MTKETTFWNKDGLANICQCLGLLICIFMLYKISYYNMPTVSAFSCQISRNIIMSEKSEGHTPTLNVRKVINVLTTDSWHSFKALWNGLWKLGWLHSLWLSRKYRKYSHEKRKIFNCNRNVLEWQIQRFSLVLAEDWFYFINIHNCKLTVIEMNLTSKVHRIKFSLFLYRWNIANL